MVKHLHSVLIFVLGFFSVAASAQGPAALTKPNDGYYRIVNARQRTDGKQYVYVTGKITAQPNATKAEATTLPGTVIHLKTENSKNPNWLDVTKLRSQGVDVINDYLNPAIDKVEKALKDKLNEKLGSFRGGIAYELFNTSVIGQWDLKMHMKPVTTPDGRSAYYAFATVPSMEPVCSFYKKYTTGGLGVLFGPSVKAAVKGVSMGLFNALEANNPDKVWDEVLKLALAKIESSPYAGTDIANVVKRYINADRINQGQTYYLMSGGLKKITVANKAFDPANPIGTSHNEYDGALPKFDFVNNNTTDQWFGPELPVTGDAAMWILEKVDDTNYFGVKPSTNMRGRDGKYYTTLYVDFPFQIKGDVKAYTIEGVEAKNADGYYFAKVKKLAQQGDVVPAQTAVVLECNSTNPADNQLLPQGDEKFNPSNNRLCGTFFGATINGLTVKDGTGVERNVTRDNIRAFNINTNDSRNPIGFYKVNSTVTTIPGNKAFLVLTNAEAQAKSFVLEFEDGSTTGIETIETSKNSTEDGVYYDLQGRRVENPTRGIYIVNGKKVVIK
ncbi:hypothetical protein [Prevotella melaninogenica]